MTDNDAAERIAADYCEGIGVALDSLDNELRGLLVGKIELYVNEAIAEETAGLRAESQRLRFVMAIIGKRLDECSAALKGGEDDE